MRSTPGERFARRAAPWVLPVAVLLGLAGLVLVSRGAVADSPRFLADPRVWDVVRRPAWMSAELADDLAMELAASLRRPASLLGGDDLQAWAGLMLGRSPWIRAVSSVSARFPYQAEVRLQVHRPVLVVEGDLLLSASGTVLGAGAVTGEPAPLAYQGAITNEDIVECAAAAGEMLAFSEQVRTLGLVLRGVSVSDEGLVVFTTGSGVALEWGRSARRRRLAALDLPQARRIANLADVVEQYPGLAGVQRVQLWLERPRVVTAPADR